MALELYGFSMSPSMQAVTTTLKKVNIPYEIVMVDVMGEENKKLEYLESMHPFGMVPVLIDDDGSKDLKKNALFEQAMSIESFNFHPYALALAARKFLKKMRGFLTSNETAAECAKNLEEKLAAYEHILSKQKYLAGEEFTLADLFHLPLGYILIGFNGLKATSNLARWWTEISSRPAWKQVREEVENFMAQMMKK
ncbi:hypothetical protein ACEPAF_2029 [Sanghuangporus sanghuang]